MRIGRIADRETARPSRALRLTPAPPAAPCASHARSWCGRRASAS